jgi:hypothetical protein
MTGKTTSTMKTLFDRIRGNEDAIAAAQRENDELRRQAAWEEGQDRRDRIAGYADEARQLIEHATASNSRITAAAIALTDAKRHLGAEVDAHNEALGAIVQKLSGEGLKNSPTPPSPADGGVGVNGTTLIVGGTHILPLNRSAAIELAIGAADRPDAVPAIPPVVVDKPLPEGRYWRNRSNGTVLMADNDLPDGCDEITRLEYLSHLWQLPLSSLPEHLLAELGDVDRARVAERMLGELDGDDRSKFAEQLLPTRKGSA